MITKIFNGKYYFNNLLKSVSKEIFFCNFFLKKSLCLSIIIVGNIFSTNLYVKNKIETCNFVGISFLIFKFSYNIKIKTLLLILSIINYDNNINGIIFQLPISKHLNKLNLFNSISFYKDIDILTSHNFGNYMLGYSKSIIPSTVKSVIFMLKKININYSGLSCVIFGFSNIVGKPLSFELVNLGMTVSVISKYDLDFLNIIKNSDVIICAVGISNFLSIDVLSRGSIVVDIGINESNYEIAFGDFYIEKKSNYVNFITPVPGGIGPLTVYNILFNLIKISINKNFVDVI